MTWTQLFYHFLNLSHAGIEILPLWALALTPIVWACRQLAIKEAQQDALND